MVFFPGSLLDGHERRHACRRYVGPEADAARQEARATSGGASFDWTGKGAGRYWAEAIRGG